MKKLISSRFLQTNHRQILYLLFQRKLESKQLFQGNFDSQYSSQFNNYYGIVDTDYSRNMTIVPPSLGQSSLVGQQICHTPPCIKEEKILSTSMFQNFEDPNRHSIKIENQVQQ